MLVFNNYFYKNKKSKLYFGDSVAVLNDFFYQTGGSNILFLGEISKCSVAFIWMLPEVSTFKLESVKVWPASIDFLALKTVVLVVGSRGKVVRLKVHTKKNWDMKCNS
jgi:hypothetical protein